MLPLALVTLTGLSALTAPAVDEDGARRLVLPVPGQSDEGPRPRATAPAPSPRPGCLVSDDGLVGLVTLGVGVLGGVFLPWLAAPLVGIAVAPATLPALLVVGPPAALVVIVMTSLIVAELTGRSPIPSWLGAVPGVILAGVSAAAFVAAEEGYATILSDEDRANASRVLPSTPAATAYCAARCCGMCGWLTAGLVVVLGASIGASLPNEPSDWAPVEAGGAPALDGPVEMPF